MRKGLIGIMSAGVIGATAIAAPTPSSANPAWLIPALIAAGVGGVVVGAGAASAAQPPAPSVAVGPPRAVECHWVRERTPRGAWRRVQICG
jgi:hypothetical protein